MGGWWSLCAPFCHEFAGPDTDDTVAKWTKAIKFCILGLALSIVAPFDGCINWVFYNMKNCTDGVKGWADVTENASFLGKKVKEALELREGGS